MQKGDQSLRLGGRTLRLVAFLSFFFQSLPLLPETIVDNWMPPHKLIKLKFFRIQ